MPIPIKQCQRASSSLLMSMKYNFLVIPAWKLNVEIPACVIVPLKTDVKTRFTKPAVPKRRDRAREMYVLKKGFICTFEKNGNYNLWILRNVFAYIMQACANDDPAKQSYTLRAEHRTPVFSPAHEWTSPSSQSKPFHSFYWLDF